MNKLYYMKKNVSLSRFFKIQIFVFGESSCFKIFDVLYSCASELILTIVSLRILDSIKEKLDHMLVYLTYEQHSYLIFSSFEKT